MGDVTGIVLGLAWLAGFGEAFVDGCAVGRAQGQEPGEPIRIESHLGHAWNPRDGRVAVLDQDGRRLLLFDHFLRPLGAHAVAARAVRAYGGFFWLQEEDGSVQRWDSSQGRLRPAPVGALGSPFSPDLLGPARGPGGRALRFEPETGVLRWGLARWEHGGEIEWGPGWATVRFRLSQPVGRYLRLRRAGEEGFELVPVVPDPRDPLLQRAYLRGLTEGETIALSHLRVAPRFPPSDWTAPEHWTVPDVDPAGARPVTVLRTPGRASTSE